MRIGDLKRFLAPMSDDATVIVTPNGLVVMDRHSHVERTFVRITDEDAAAEWVTSSARREGN